MGYEGYFLIVADFVNWAKKNQVPVGPGRTRSRVFNCLFFGHYWIRPNEIRFII